MNQASILARYLENGYFDRKSKLVNLISARLVSYIAFQQAKSLFRIAASNLQKENISITIPAYMGNHPVLKEVIGFFKENKHPALKQAVIFGSLADETNCNYSDFDGLLVINTDKIRNRRSLYELRMLIQNAEEFLLKVDSLQHHGWLIYPADTNECPLPLLSISTALAIYPTEQITISQFLIKNVQEQSNLKNTIASILRKLNKGSTEKNLFEFKTLCSEFMLLPALALQEHTGKPVSKRESFDLLFKTFPTLSDNAMKTVSEWRNNWTQPEHNLKLSVFHFLKKRGIIITALCPKVPQNLLLKYRQSWKIEAFDFCMSLSSITENKPNH